MIDWLATPTGHFVSHILTAVTVGAIGWGLWHYANRGEDVRDTVVELDDDVEDLLDRVHYLEDRAEHLEKRAVQIVDWLWKASGHERPDEGVPTEEHPAVVDDEPDDDGPATDIAHAADTQARKWSLLHKRADPETVITEGRHRPEAGGRSVHELIAEAGHEPMRGAKSLPQRATD